MQTSCFCLLGASGMTPRQGVLDVSGGGGDAEDAGNIPPSYLSSLPEIKKRAVRRRDLGWGTYSIVRLMGKN